MSEVDQTIHGREFLSKTTALFVDGYWEIVSSIIEKRSFNGVDWETREVSAKGIDHNFMDAYNTAITSVVDQFNQVLEENKSRSLFKGELRNEITQIG